MTNRRGLEGGGDGQSSHADTHLLSDTISTSATWSDRQQELEEIDH